MLLHPPDRAMLKISTSNARGQGFLRTSRRLQQSRLVITEHDFSWLSASAPGSRCDHSSVLGRRTALPLLLLRRKVANSAGLRDLSRFVAAGTGFLTLTRAKCVPSCLGIS
jgi:hypothetical protein